jgi:hypothetical protein
MPESAGIIIGRLYRHWGMQTEGSLESRSQGRSRPLGQGGERRGGMATRGWFPVGPYRKTHICVRRSITFMSR